MWVLLSDPSGNSNLVQPIDAQNSQKHFVDTKMVVTNLVLGLLALISGVLEYVVYQTIISNDFGETNVSLKLSFLSFRYFATRCIGGYCTRLAGVPAFDFFQLFIYLIIVYNVLKFIQSR